MNYVTLKGLLDSLNEDNDLALAEVNLSNIAVKVNIETADIKQYLTAVGKRVAIDDSNNEAGKAAKLALDDFEFFVMSDPTNVAVLSNSINALTELGASEKAYILAMGDSTESIAEQAGLGLVDINHIKHARGG
ncbi:MAG: hypothetical protein JKY52_09905, partial [Flavobacteriales bacterium]|nr:hypothetical protein [Flavobacteriales bacterium]